MSSYRHNTYDISKDFIVSFGTLQPQGRESIDPEDLEGKTSLYSDNDNLNYVDLHDLELKSGVLIQSSSIEGSIDASGGNISVFGVSNTDVSEINIEGCKIDFLYADNPWNYEWKTDSDTRVETTASEEACSDIKSYLEPEQTEAFNLNKKFNFMGISLDYNPEIRRPKLGKPWETKEIGQTYFVGQD